MVFWREDDNLSLILIQFQHIVGHPSLYISQAGLQFWSDVHPWGLWLDNEVKVCVICICMVAILVVSDDATNWLHVHAVALGT